MPDWRVNLDGGVHTYQGDEPPVVGKFQDLGGLFAYVEEEAKSADGKPLFKAKPAVSCALMCGNATTNPIGDDWIPRLHDPEQAPFHICPNHTEDEIAKFGGTAPT